MPLRVARRDRRWKGSCGRSLVPGSVWCKEGSIPWVAVLGVCARLQTPGLVWPSLEAWCAPSHASWTPWLCERAWALTVLRGAGPWLWRRAWIFTCCMCCALSTYDLNTKNRTSPPATRPAVTTGQCKKTARPFCQRFRPGTQRARPFQQPHTHSCSSRLFLTVPRHLHK